MMAAQMSGEITLSIYGGVGKTGSGRCVGKTGIWEREIT